MEQRLQGELPQGLSVAGSAHAMAQSPNARFTPWPCFFGVALSPEQVIICQPGVVP